MALNLAAEKVAQTKPGPRCGFGAILKALGKDDADYYDLMVAEGRTSTYIADVFREDGHDVSEYTIRRHRNGRCACR